MLFFSYFVAYLRVLGSMWYCQNYGKFICFLVKFLIKLSNKLFYYQIIVFSIVLANWFMLQ